MKKTLSLFVALLAITGAAYALPSCNNTLNNILGGCSIGTVDFTNFVGTYGFANQVPLINADVTVTALSGATMVGLLFTPTATSNKFTATPADPNATYAKNDIKITYEFKWMGAGLNPYDTVKFSLNGVSFSGGDDPLNTNNVNSGKTIFDWDTPSNNLSGFPIAKFDPQSGSFTNSGNMALAGRQYFGVADNPTLWAYRAVGSASATATNITGFANEFSYVPQGDIPEPLSFVLLGSGLLAFGLLRRKSA